MRIVVLRALDDVAIPGARVTTIQGRETTTVETGLDGTCTLGLAPSGEVVRLRVEKEGFFHVSANYQRLENLTIRLSRATTVFGQVVTADTREPVPDAKVTFGHGWCKGCEPQHAVSGNDGSYELHGLPLRRPIDLRLEAPGFPDQGRQVELRSDEPRVEVELRLERGMECQGRVVDFVTGAGIPAATAGSLVADASGTFRGRVLPQAGAERVDLVVGAEGYCVLFCYFALDELASLPEIRLPRGAIVEGLVRDEAGQPIPGALLRVDSDVRAEVKETQAGPALEPSPLDELPEEWYFAPEGYDSSARADDRGRFRVANVVPWSSYQAVEALADGFASASRSFERIGGPGETTWVELVLGPETKEVHVSGEIWLNGHQFRTAKGRVRWKGPSRSGESELYHGRFYLQAEPGEVAFQLEIDGFTAPLEGTEFVLQLEEDTSKHRFELTTPTRPIRGRVTFEDGQPADRASVSASCALHGTGRDWWDQLHVGTKTAEDGTFVLEVPDLAGSYRLTAELDEAVQETEGIRPGASGIDFVLKRSGVLLFRFQDAARKASLDVSDFELGWRAAGEQEFHPLNLGWPLAPDPDGWYELRLPSGRIDLKANQDNPGADAYRPTLVEDALIEPDRPLKMEFEMSRSLVAELRLAAEQPPLPADHTVFFVESELYDELKYSRESGSLDGGRLGPEIRQRFVRFDKQRSAKISGLAPGRFRFKVFPDDLLIEPTEVVLASEVNEPVLVRWGRVR